MVQQTGHTHRAMGGACSGRQFDYRYFASGHSTRSGAETVRAKHGQQESAS